MQMNNMIPRVEDDNSLPSKASLVHILLVDPDNSSLMFVTSLFEQQHYKVTPAESITIAMMLLSARRGYYDVVVADCHIPGIYPFVHLVRGMALPIILMSENYTQDLAKKAIDEGASHFFSKPPMHVEIVCLWHDIGRVTGLMPGDGPKDDININAEKCNGFSTSSGTSCRSTEGTLKRKTINTDFNNGRNKVVENSDSDDDEEEEEDDKDNDDEDYGHHYKKLRLTCTFSPEANVQQVPSPDLQSGPFSTPGTTSSIIPDLQPTATQNNAVQRPTSEAPPSPCIGLDSLQQMLDKMNLDGDLPTSDSDGLDANSATGHLGTMDNNTGEDIPETHHQADAKTDTDTLTDDDIDWIIQCLEAAGVNLFDFID